MHRFVKDRTGIRYGSLVAVCHLGSIKVGRTKAPNALWECRCDCGTTVKVAGRDLQTGHVRSCGCLRRKLLSDLGKKNAKPEGESLRNQLFSVYQRGAKRRDYVWGLSKVEFDTLISGYCHYCGVSPITKRKGWKDFLLYNGIDRLDSTYGYTIGNVVSCCSVCNRMKGTLTPQEFTLQARKITAHNETVIDFTDKID